MADVRNQLVFTLDYLSMRIDKYRALERFAVTRRTMIIEGYVPADKSRDSCSRAHAKIHNLCYGKRAVRARPVRLLAFKNAMPVADYRGHNRIVWRTLKDDVDPNPVMAVFYYLFLGMLSDADTG